MWSGMPFVRIAIPYAAGIWCAGGWDIGPVAWEWLGGTCLIGWLVAGRLPPGLAWQWEPARGLAVLMCILSAGGMTLCGKRHAQQSADKAQMSKDSSLAWICTMEESPQRKRNSFRGTATIEALNIDRHVIAAGHGLVYFPADSGVKPPQIGSRLIIRIRPDKLKGPEYPGGFDAAGYFGRQGIGYRIFLRSGDWIVMDSSKGSGIPAILELTRAHVLNTLSTHIRDKSSLGLAEALLIGYRNDLDERLSDAYAETGVIHVIAISGLHIGVIYGLLIGLLNLVLRGRRVRWIATGCALTGIWAFGLLAGGGPSVMRSVCMFSVIGIGREITGREGGGLNTLAAVGGLMLAAQPWWLWDLGFQLSFCAVTGLMIFYRPVLALLAIRNPLALKGWEMIAVTLAAQILTTPLLLHAFGRFPLLFLITNLVAIPLSTVILLGELALCLLAPLHAGLADGCGEAVTWLIQHLNAYIFRMESVPFGTLGDIHITTGEMTAIYLAIGCLSAWGMRRQPAWLMAGLLFLLISGTLHVRSTLIRKHQQAFVVMPFTQTRLLLLVEGQSCRWLLTPFGRQDTRQLRLAMRATAHHFGIRKQWVDTLPASGHYKLGWKGLVIHLTSGRCPPPDPADMSDADLAVLSGNGPLHAERLMAASPRTVWIADGTNRLWKILQWETAGERLPLRLISTRRSGAFIRRIR